MNEITKGQWTIKNSGDLYTIKLTDEEGTESIMAYGSQLAELKLILASLELPIPENELPL